MMQKFFQKTIHSFKENKLFYVRLVFYFSIICSVVSILNLIAKQYSKNKKKKKNIATQNQKKKKEKPIMKFIEDWDDVQKKMQETEKQYAEILTNIQDILMRLNLQPDHKELFQNIKSLLLTFAPGPIFHKNYGESADILKIKINSFKNIHNILYQQKEYFNKPENKNEKQKFLDNFKKEIIQYIKEKKILEEGLAKKKTENGFFKQVSSLIQNKIALDFIRHDNNLEQIIKNILPILGEFLDLWLQKQWDKDFMKEMLEEFFELVACATAFAKQYVTAEALLNDTVVFGVEKPIKFFYPQINKEILNSISLISEKQYLKETEESIKTEEEKIKKKEEKLKKQKNSPELSDKKKQKLEEKKQKLEEKKQEFKKLKEKIKNIEDRAMEKLKNLEFQRRLKIFPTASDLD